MATKTLSIPASQVGFASHGSFYAADAKNPVSGLQMGLQMSGIVTKDIEGIPNLDPATHTTSTRLFRHCQSPA